MIDQQHIQNITTALVPEYANFIKGPFANTAADQFARKHQFTVEQKESLHEGIILYLLTVFTASDLIDHIVLSCDLSEDDARLLVYALHLTLPPNFSRLHAETKTALEGLSISQAGQPQTSPQQTGVVLQSTPALRTMASDMAKSQAAGENVYTSTQEAILKEGWSTPKPPQTPPQTS